MSDKEPTPSAPPTAANQAPPTAANQDSFVVVKQNEDKLAYDIDFNFNLVASLTEDQEKLLNDVRKALTVVKVVFAKRHKSSKTHTAISLFGKTPSKPHEQNVSNNIALRYSHYISELADIARMGIRAVDRVRFANSLLEGFKSDFVSSECHFVKNQYVEMLGRHALTIGLALGVSYIIVEMIGTHHGFFHEYKAFLLMAAADCAGTWLSFSLRRVTLGFTDLANLEEDLLKPTTRLLFVIGLTWVMALFIATKIIDFRIGEVQLTANLLHSGAIAALMGVVCGISERALASVVSGHSDQLIGGVSGPPVQPK